MTKWMKETQTTTTKDMMKVVLAGKQHIYKGIGRLQPTQPTSGGDDVQIVSKPPSHSNGDPIYRFWTSRP